MQITSVIFVFLGVICCALSQSVSVENLNLLQTMDACAVPGPFGNPCIDCYLITGCFSCITGSDTIQCLPDIYVESGVIKKGLDYCVSYNTTFGSNYVSPAECMWHGMGDWIYKYVDRLDVIMTVEDQSNLTELVQEDLEKYETLLSDLEELANKTDSTSLLTVIEDVTNLTVTEFDHLVENIDSMNGFWLAEVLRLEYFNLVVDIHLAKLEELRVIAQDLNLTEIQIAEAILIHHELLLPFSCNATTRLQQRLASLRLAALVLENLIIIRLENSTLEVALVRTALAANLTTVEVAEQLFTSLFEYRNYLWGRLVDVETLKHQVDIFIIKLDSLLERKCVLNIEALYLLEERIAHFKASVFADITIIKSLINNETRMAIIEDLVYDFIVELKELNVSYSTNFVDHVILHHRIAHLITEIKENIENASKILCDSIRPMLIAHLGLKRTDAICDPSSATLLTGLLKRQVGLDSNDQNSELYYEIDVTAQSASTTGSPNTGSVGVMAVSFLGLVLLLSTFL
jgi:hypothetical protein